MNYIISREEAEGIAEIAAALKTESVLDSTGYYVIAERDEDSWCVDISRYDGGFEVCVSFPNDDNDWFFEENKERLVERIMKLANEYGET